MNLNELKAKYIQYLTEKGELDDEKLSMLTSGLTSVFFLGSDFTQFVKENLSSLGIKTTGKIPNTISEILELAEEEDETYDIKDEDNKEEKAYSSNETTYNKDYSKNYIKNNYDKDGNVVNQYSSVYSATGAKKSQYNIEFGAEGDVKNETQIEYGSATNSESDLAIGYSEQGEKGDCWLLATLNSLGSTESGKEIIKNAISKNDDGSYSINFKGVNKSIKITQEELDAAKKSGKYAKGDDDVTLFELGFESVIDKIQKGEIKVDGNHPNLSIKEGDTTSPLSGGNLEDAIFLLTGKDVKSEFKKSGASTEEFDKILSSLKDNPDKYAALIGFGGGTDGLTLKDINGNVICNIEAGSTHAFSIKSVDEDSVTIVNPWDSSKEYKISIADARKFGTGIQYYATDDSFTETNTFDSAKLDQMPTQSEGGTDAEPSETIDGISPTPEPEKPTDDTKPQEGTAPIEKSSGGNPYNPNVPSATPAPSKGPTETSEGIAKEVGSIDEQIAAKNAEIATKNAEKAALRADDATYKGLLDNLDNATKAVDTATKNIATYETELHAIETSINTKRAQLDNIVDPVVFTEYKDDFEKQRASLKSEIEDLEKQKSEKQEAIEKEKATKTEKEQEKSNLEQQVKEYEAANPNEQIDRINQEIDTLKSDIQSLETQKAAKEKELEDSRKLEKSDAEVYGKMLAVRNNNEFTKWMMDHATSDAVRNQYDQTNWGGAWCAIFTSDMTEALYAEVAKRIGANGLSKSSQGLDGLQVAMHAVAWGNKYQGDLNSAGVNKRASVVIRDKNGNLLLKDENGNTVDPKDAVRKGLIYPGMTFEYELNGHYHTGFIESINADLTWNTYEGNSTGGKCGAHRRDAENQRLTSVTDTTLKVYAWLIQSGKMSKQQAAKLLNITDMSSVMA